MKLNWGTSIVIAFLAFIAFIMYFVITITTNTEYDHDLVTEEYYKKELAFQDKLEKEQNTINSGYTIQHKKTAEGLQLIFPDRLTYSKIKGTVFLYRPSDKKLDFEIPFSLSGHHLLIPDKHLLDGRWNIAIEWTYQGNDYFIRKEILY